MEWNKRKLIAVDQLFTKINNCTDNAIKKKEQNGMKHFGEANKDDYNN